MTGVDVRVVNDTVRDVLRDTYAVDGVVTRATGAAEVAC